MAANHFKIEGERIDSLSEFLRREKDGEWKNVLYYPEKFQSDDRHPLVFTEKRFVEVSFKDTDLINVRFIRCTFEKCLFIGSSATDCEFTDCNFIDTNTSKMKISRCLIDPRCFDRNFDLKSDTNIAIDLYHSLYKNASSEHQPEHALESLYRMKKAENRHLDSQKRRKVIDWKTFLIKKSGYLVADFVSGYGLRTSRVLRLLLIVITVFSALNYKFREFIFPNVEVDSLIDAIYFTCVTIATLGYGDITPSTQFGKIFVTFQALSGFVVISLFLAAVANRALRAR